MLIFMIIKDNILNTLSNSQLTTHNSQLTTHNSQLTKNLYFIFNAFPFGIASVFYFDDKSYSSRYSILLYKLINHIYGGRICPLKKKEKRSSI